MKKSLSIVSAIIIMLTLTVFSYASFENGDLYEVPITMIHAEKDKTSMGDKYILNTALIEVKNGTKYLTMVTDSEVKNLNFWYYKNGSVEGETIEAEKTYNVKIDGKTYELGYRFPLMGEEQLAGVKFSASVMPMTPSARIKIDYNSAKLISRVTTTKSTTTTSTMQAKTDVTSGTTAQPQENSKKEELSLTTQSTSKSKLNETTLSTPQTNEKPAETAKKTIDRMPAIIGGCIVAVISIAVTSNIDIESENDIMTVIRELAKTKTVVLISHRLANVVESDNIYVLETGNLSEAGTHKELMANCGVYFRLFNAQQELENFSKGGKDNEEKKQS